MDGAILAVPMFQEVLVEVYMAEMLQGLRTAQVAVAATMAVVAETAIHRVAFIQETAQEVVALLM